MVTLSDFRTEVRAYLDDEDAVRYSNTVIDFAARGALTQLVNMYVDQGNALDQVAEVTTTSGAVNLTSYSPLRIHSVSVKSGTNYYPVPALRERDRTQDVTGTHTLRISYVAQPTFPEGDGYAFDYGPGTSTFSSDAWDNLLVVLAVKQLMTIEGEQHMLPVLTEQSYWNAVLSDVSAPAAYDLYPDSRRYDWNFGADYGYTYRGQTIQLARV